MHELDKTGLEALKPCPFCGGEARVSHYETESLWSHDQVTYTKVSCVECDISLQSEPGYETEAIEAWNTRASTTSAGVTEEQTPRVKQLEWRDQQDADEDGGFDVVGSWADAGLVHYWTDRDYAQEDPIKLYRGDRTVGWFPSEKEAQVAAQSDFETRILPFLEASRAAPVSQKEAGSVPSALDRIMADDRLRRARSKLSFDEIKKIIDHTKAAIREGGSNA